MVEPGDGRTKRWVRSLGSPTIRGALNVISGTTAAQAVTIAAAPLLTRLFTPADFGVLTVFAAVSSVLIVVATGRYEWAIPLPESEDDGLALAALTLALTTAVAVLLLVTIAATYGTWIVPAFPDLGVWAFLVPATVLMGGWSATFRAYATRIGQFRLIGRAEVSRKIVGTGAQCALGVAGLTPGGLIVGSFLNVAASNARLGAPLLVRLRQRRPTLGDLRVAAKDYLRFPRLSLPAGLLNVAFLHGTPLVIGALYGLSTLGQWSVAQRVLVLPATLISAGVGLAYYRRAIELRDNSREATRLFDRAVLVLAAAALPPFAVLAVFAEGLFTTVFGPSWGPAGEYARIMIPWLMLRFILSPLGSVAMVYGRNGIQLIATGAQVLLLGACAASAVALGLSFSSFLWALSLAIAASEVVIALVGRHLVRRGLPSEASDHA